MTYASTLPQRSAAPKLALRGLLALTFLALAVAPLWAGRADLRLLMEALSFLALAQMWNLLAGYTGLISVGQQAFVGLGGYIFFATAMFAGFPVLAAIPAAALATALIAIPTGWVAFRLQGGANEAGVFLTQRVVDKLPDTMPFADSGVVEVSGGYQRVWRLDPKAADAPR